MSCLLACGRDCRGCRHSSRLDSCLLRCPLRTGATPPNSLLSFLFYPKRVVKDSAIMNSKRLSNGILVAKPWQQVCTKRRKNKSVAASFTPACPKHYPVSKHGFAALAQTWTGPQIILCVHAGGNMPLFLYRLPRLPKPRSRKSFSPASRCRKNFFGLTLRLAFC